MALATAAVVTDAAGDVHAAEIVRDARREHLAELLAFIDGACARAGLDPDIRFDVRLATEEVVTNVIEHGYAGMPTGPVTVRFQCEPARVIVTVDDLARPFDPALVPRPDTAAPIEQRRSGGLGWHLVHQIMDEVRHEPRTPMGNRLTLVKRLHSTH
ncbi:MAG TPA: ATP-binding protein [Gemmatimonadaceae bacterium]|jgi:serine/threonine-protein kinase RsbW|nr:ATP-binding protein [Gemmatimonadaceae bacterium]